VPPALPAIEIGPSSLDGAGASTVAVGFTGGDGQYVVDRGSAEALNRLGLDALQILERADSDGRGGSTVVHTLASGDLRQVVLLGLGEENPTDFRRAGAALVRLVRTSSPAVTSIGTAADSRQLGAFCEGVLLGGFQFTRASQQGTEAVPCVLLTGVSSQEEDVLRRARIRAEAAWRARTFATTPSNEKSPRRLEEWAREAADHAGLELDVWDDDRLAADGMGGILAVGSGSAHDSRLIRLDYRPAGGAAAPHVVLVGKGITFDSGGLSIKPAEGMMTMKRDMTGAGVVIAVMGALRDLDVPVAVTGLAASAENAVGGRSMRPGDVIRHYGGRTSEVGNTDAEGRLVLADALAYADANLDPDVVVDVATLTGAARVALGTSLGALLANDDHLADQLQVAGEEAGEPVWRLPLSEEYEPRLESPVADATNAPGGPGAITAALFLQHFVGDRPWAHLDIASIGDSAEDAFEYTQGPTGFGARLLLSWLNGM
jgi:leucyl aminopeptidase